MKWQVVPCMVLLLILLSQWILNKPMHWTPLDLNWPFTNQLVHLLSNMLERPTTNPFGCGNVDYVVPMRLPR